MQSSEAAPRLRTARIWSWTVGLGIYGMGALITYWYCLLLSSSPTLGFYGWGWALFVGAAVSTAPIFPAWLMARATALAVEDVRSTVLALPLIVAGLMVLFGPDRLMAALIGSIYLAWLETRTEGRDAQA